MDTMPNQYETQQTTTTTTTTTGTTSVGRGPIRVPVNLSYLRTLPGILKIVEMVLDLIIVICVAATMAHWSYSPPGSYCTFVGAFGIITTLIFFIFHFVGIIYKLPGPWVLIEFGYLVFMAIFTLISGIVAATEAYFFKSGAVATSVFSFFALLTYAVEIFLCFRVWRTGGGFYVATTTTGAPATATTTNTTKEEYVTSP